MKILTWNIQWARGLDGQVDPARTAATINDMGRFDVICLQEVAVNFPGLAGSRGEDDIAELAMRLPGYTPVFAPATDLPDDRGGRRLFGNAVFSSLPVGQVFRHLLPWPVDPATPSMQRVLLEVVVTAPFGLLRVMTTHLEYYSPRIRSAQIEAIRSLHAEACAHARKPRWGEGEQGGSFEALPRPAAAILCGDMNFPAWAKDRSHLLAAYDDATPAWMDCWELLHPGVAHAPTVGIHPVDFVDRPECFDFVFVTEDLAPRLCRHAIDADTAASDHQPVWVELSG